MRKALFLRIPRCALDLVVVVVQSNDVHTTELDNLASGSSHTTADIKHPHVVTESHHVRQVVLVAGNGLVEVFAERIAAKVETLTPAILVQIGGKVVVVPGQGRVFVPAGLQHVRNQKRAGVEDCRTFRVSSVSTSADLLSQCLKYSSTAAFCAAVSFWSKALIPPCAWADLPCMALLKAASREWSSCSSAVGDMLNERARMCRTRRSRG